MDKDRIDGAANQAKGAVKEAVGKATGDAKLQTEGVADKLKGKVQKQWGKLTNDDLDVIEGNRKELVGRVQHRYGYARDQAEKEVDSFVRSLH